MKTTRRRQQKKKSRRFAPIDLENLSSTDETENPDWLVGAN